MHFFDYSGGAMGWGALGMVLWWALPILGIVALVAWLIRSDGRRREKTALDILEERYARGEIGDEEFQRKKRELQG